MRIVAVETAQLVGDGRPALVTRSRRRAERRARKLNSYRLVPFYRWEAVLEDGRWRVLPFQNVAKAVE